MVSHQEQKWISSGRGVLEQLKMQQMQYVFTFMLTLPTIHSSPLLYLKMIYVMLWMELIKMKINLINSYDSLLLLHLSKSFTSSDASADIGTWCIGSFHLHVYMFLCCIDAVIMMHYKFNLSVCIL